MEDMLGRGGFDDMFAKAPHRLSAIYADSQRAWPEPTAILKSATELWPIGDVPIYPDIARLARIHGVVTISGSVMPDGSMMDPQVSGHPVLTQAATARVAKWTFEPSAAERKFDGTIEYELNCPVKSGTRVDRGRPSNAVALFS